MQWEALGAAMLMLGAAFFVKRLTEIEKRLAFAEDHRFITDRAMKQLGKHLLGYDPICEDEE